MQQRSADEAAGGFRLHALELRNWGTFHDRVWRIAPGGDNALLTGDIGSGKSTLVDALTTLLVPKPANQIVFNKAAGSEAQERSLASYVKGEYKSEKDELTSGARAVSLRDEDSFSVLLARFENPALGQGATIAQLLYFKDRGGKVDRLFVVTDQQLSIREQFTRFDNIAHLKRRLRRQDIQVTGGLKEYASWMRRALGIESERALELFYQTVSMKSVDNLTQFVRRHMLEPGDSRKRVEILCQSFEDLDRAHSAVVTARSQIEALTPLVAGGEKLLELEREQHALRQSRELLESWRASHELELEGERELKLLGDLERVELRLEKLKNDILELKGREESIQNSLDDHGGRRLKEIALELQRMEKELDRRKGYAQQYQTLAKQLAFPVPESADIFLECRERIEQLAHENREALDRLDDQRSELIADERQRNETIAGLSREIAELKKRSDNIPANSIQLRRVLCEALSIDELRLPFAGELIQVLEGAREWEGAIERVLHNFGLSLLVPEDLYGKVADYVDRTHLRGRLVYFRISRPQRAADPRDLSLQSLVRKLQIKDDNLCYDWLLTRLSERFDYSCCDRIADFRHHRRAITRNGQIKSGGDRHEKDDRHNLHDRSRYVLGWDNRDKRRALESQRADHQRAAAEIGSRLAELNTRKVQIDARLQACTSLKMVPDFTEIDWRSTAELIHSLQNEQRQIEGSSDILKELQLKLEQAHQVREEKEQRHQDAIERQAEFRAKLNQCRDNQREARAIVEESDEPFLKQHLPTLNAFHQGRYDTPPNLQNIRSRERALRTALQNEIDNGDRKRDRLRSRVEKRMSDYCHDNPAETQEVDAGIDALDDYRRMLTELREDDLPRFESRFKQELNEKTIQSLLHFSTQLDRAESELKSRIGHINASLTKIDYNPGSFIQLMAEGINDSEIREFRQDLRGCLSDSLGKELYDESRFLQVKAIIERFRGREGHSDADKRWTLKVTDVRNWFGFSAEELWREDGSRRDYFESSSGKSGGQKEKLAYTVLASALAYQFGLDRNDNLRAYRFVVIDEAFGRGSESSTRYALELFKQLGLQLLVVTPLQKIHVIEPYINHLHFVHNEEHRESQLRNMTIEEYREEKARREQQELQAAVAAIQR